MNKLRLGLPIGSLQQSTLAILERAGFNVTVRKRSYRPSIDDHEIEPRLVRPQHMAMYVEQGVLDAGLTGLDWVMENQSDVQKVTDLIYAKQGWTPVKWVLAVPGDSDIDSPGKLQGKTIATELINVTNEYLKKHGVNAQVIFSHGATEDMTPDIVDAIVDVTETGATLKAHGLKIIDTVLESNTQLIANRQAWNDDWKREKIEDLKVLVEGAISAQAMAGLKMNVPEDKLESVLAQLPAMKAPTISQLSGQSGCAVEIVVREDVVRTLIPKLKKAGASGIVEYPLNKVIP